RLLTVTKPSNGTITSSVGGVQVINCGTGGNTCTYNYDDNTTAVLTATPDTGYSFTSWGSPCSGNAGCSILMNGNKTLAASTFTVNTYTLAVTPPTNGTVTGFSGGINCSSSDLAGSANCTETVTFGQSYTLTANPATGYSFSSWGLDCNGQANPCTFTADTTPAVSVSFSANSYTLVVTPAENGTITGTGINCTTAVGADCSELRTFGTTLTLTATPDANYRRGLWGDDCPTPSAATCTLTIDTDPTASVTFVATSTLTLTVTGKGSVQANAPPIGAGETQTCNAALAASATCTFTYDETAGSITFTPSPDSGWSFRSFSDAISCTGGTCTWTVGANNVTSTALFLERKTLTINVTGQGTVTLSPAPVVGAATCTETCTRTFDNTDVVTLSVVAAAGWRFDAWSNGCSGSGTCSVTIDNQNKSVSATFIKTYVLTVTQPDHGSIVTVNGDGDAIAGIDCPSSGTTDCTETYDTGTSVKLKVTADDTWRFDAWGGACSGEATTTCTVSMTVSDKTVSASFVKTQVLTITQAAQVAIATTTINSVAPGSAINCAAGSGTCAYTYDLNDVIVLTATAEPTYRFTGWTGTAGCSGTGTCTVTMAADYGVSATFVKTYVLSVSTNVGGSIKTVDGSGDAITGILCTSAGGAGCSKTYDVNSSVTLKAFPATGYRFGTWDTDCSGTSLTCALSMTGNKTVGATFVKTYTLTLEAPNHGTIDWQDDAASPANATCPPTCGELTYDASPLVTVTLTANDEIIGGSLWTFQSWTGCPSAAGNVCTVAMDADRTVTAVFTTTWTLTVTRNTTGNVTGSGSINCGSGGTKCTATFNDQASVTLTAVAGSGYRFKAWVEGYDCEGQTATCTLTMDGNKSAVPSYQRVRLLTVTKPSNGTITSSVGGVQVINCGTGGNTCTYNYDDNTTAVLTAT
ncbi:MAG: InlB B-repeat-containing protein, partial [Actinomycetota bacterium]